jgi:Rieske Fe-S protein
LPAACSAARPRPSNLKVPPYTFVSDTTLLIGEDQEKKGA